MHALVSWTRPNYAVAAEMMHTAEVSCSSTFDKGSSACCEHFLMACQNMTSAFWRKTRGIVFRSIPCWSK